MYQVMVVDDEPMAASLIVNIIKRKYSNCRYQDASFQEYGFGATMVTVK